MKTSVAVSVFILAIGLGFGWWNHQRFAFAEGTQKQLLSALAKNGVIISSGDLGRITKLTREDTLERGEHATRRIIELEKAADGLPDSDKENLVLYQKLRRDRAILVKSLDSVGLKHLINTAKAEEGLSKKSREKLIFFALTNLAIDYPQAVLEIIVSTPDLVGSGDLSKYNVSFALGRLARENPTAALAWFKENKERFPDSNSADKIIIGTATHDPKLAFSLIRELNVKDERKAVKDILNTAVSPEENTAVFSALRNHLAGMDSLEKREVIKRAGFQVLAENLTRDGFDAASRWLATMKPTPDELESLANGLHHPRVSAESGRWMEWLGINLAAGKYEQRVGQMMQSWASSDFRAAGKWLGETPDSPVKTIATQSYAASISRCYPETAVQWALTLPPGQGREKTLKEIHQNWPADSPEAAAAFAKEYGIPDSDPP